jgi:signal transduction histidine kinase
VQAKQSFTASEMYSPSESTTPPLPVCAAVAVASARAMGASGSAIPRGLLSQPDHDLSQPCSAADRGEGLLHDARNLMGALGLYCDLLSMPGVLKPEHRHYSTEVRLLGARSAAMIQQLMEQSLQAQAAAGCSWLNKSPKTAGTGSLGAATANSPDIAAIGQTARTLNPVSLRSIIDRCSGLLGRVACGKTVEISYGVAAAIEVLVGEDAVERILVNLVRNSAVALGKREPAFNSNADLHGEGAGEATCCDSTQSFLAVPQRQVRETATDPTDDETPGSIRIGVGLLVNRVGDPTPWPFRRVRLTVEDSGCGMPPEQLDRLLSGGRAPSRGSHGIGLRVVRDLVADSGGDLRVMSAPGVGTRVQIEWPMAVPPADTSGSHDLARAGAERRQSC